MLASPEASVLMSEVGQTKPTHLWPCDFICHLVRPPQTSDIFGAPKMLLIELQTTISAARARTLVRGERKLTVFYRDEGRPF